MGVPREYQSEPETQHLYDFVTQGKAAGVDSTIYLMLVEWLSMHLNLVCRSHGFDFGESSVIGIAMQYPDQGADSVYVLMDSEILTGTPVDYLGRGLDNACELSLGYGRLLRLLDCMQFQYDALSEENDLSDIHFRETQDVFFQFFLLSQQ